MTLVVRMPRRFIGVVVALVFGAACSPPGGPTTSPNVGPSSVATPSPTADPLTVCVAIDQPTCRLVAQRAEETGLSLEPGESVIRRVVEKTRVRMCDGILDPLYDVTFDIQPSGRIVLTVGRMPDGRLFACTY
jgi:hypothetical protein